MNAGAWVARRRRAPFEPVGDRNDPVPRFSRFAAAMEAAPPPSAQVLQDAHDRSVAAAPPAAAPLAAKPIVVEQPPVRAETVGRVASRPHMMAERQVITEAQVITEPHVITERHVATEPHGMAGPQVVPAWTEPAPSRATAPIAAGPVIPRRPVVDDAGRGDIPWLGIGSWLLLCGALFASLIGWPGQTSLDRVSQLWASAVASMDGAARPGQDEPTAVQSAALPQDAPAWSALPDTAGDPQTLPPTELAPPIGRAVERIPGGPPLPQFKPIVDGVAAKFSNAFFEIGERLQQEGNMDAASHMRRQGSKLDPWRGPGGSEL